MFAHDQLCEFNFVLEFNLPRAISDNQEHIKLTVHHVDLPEIEIPMCPIGCNFISSRIGCEIYCIEYYKYIKDILPIINKWVESIYCACNKLNCDRNDLFVKAKLYAYKNDGSLFNKFDILDLHPLFNDINIHIYKDGTIEGYADRAIELVFKCENMVEDNY